MKAHRRSMRSTRSDDVKTAVLEPSRCQFGQDSLSKQGHVEANTAGRGLPSSDPSLGNRSLDGMYTDGIGTLKYTLYLSSALRERPALFVMLHGASQTASDFATGTRMAEVVEEFGGIALFPEQSRNAHPLGSWNWYDTRHQFAQGGELQGKLHGRVGPRRFA